MDQQHSHTKSVFDPPIPISPIDFPEHVATPRIIKSTQAEVLHNNAVKSSESLATKIARSEWTRRTREQLWQLQRAEETRFAESIREEESSELDGNDRDKCSQDSAFSYPKELPAIENALEMNALLEKGSKALIDKTSSASPVPFKLPELNFPLPDLRMSVLMSDINNPDRDIPIRSISEYKDSQEPNQIENAVHTREPDHQSVSIATSSFGQGESPIRTTDLKNTAANSVSLAEGACSVALDRNPKSDEISLGTRDSSSISELGHAVNTRIFASSAPSLNTDSEESLFSDLTSLASALRNRAVSSTSPVVSEQCVEVQPRNLPSIYHVRSAPNVLATAADYPTSDDPFTSYSAQRRSYATLHNAGTRVRPPMVNSVRSPSLGYPELPVIESFPNFKQEHQPQHYDMCNKKNCHELSGEPVSEVRFHELPDKGSR